MTVRIHIMIDGQYIPWDSLDPELQRKIGIELNDRAMKAAGYTKINTTIVNINEPES